MAEPGPSWLSALREQVLAPRLTWNDRVMVFLAAFDVILLAVRHDVPFLDEPQTAAWLEIVQWVDLGIVAIFAVEFLLSLAIARDRAGFVKANWYDLVGLIPLHAALLRTFRLGRIVRIYVWGSRFPHELEEKFGGEAYLVQVFRKYEPVIVEEVTDPVLVKLLGVLRRVLGDGRYANAVGESLAARRDEIHAVVVDAIRKSPALRAAYAFPPVRAGVDETERQILEVTVGALTDPRLDDIIRKSIDDALAGLQASVAEKKWQKEGGIPS